MCDDWTPSKGKLAGCPAKTEDWQAATWKALGFELKELHCFRYKLTHTKTGFAILASGDLDGDETTSTFRIKATMKNDGPLELGALEVENELE